jgi:hypothetical protein
MSLLPGVNLNLEKTAYDMFGGAVRDFGGRAIGSIGGDILKSVVGNEEGEGAAPFSGAWQSTRYAADLIQYAPKHRFMFKVEFKFNPTYVEKLMGGREKNAFTFLVKMVDRPKVEFVYEDVNYYNYRTKVLKEIRHDALSMTFIDDIGNNTTDFFNAYRKSYSPISRNAFPTGLDPRMAAMTGMNFSFPLIENQQDTAARGFLANNAINVLDSVIIRQIFAHGTRMCEYTFHNPRILRFDFDEVNHETGEGNGLSVQFDYDALYVSEMKNTDGTPAPMWGKTDILGNRPGSGSGGISPEQRVAGGLFDSVINAGTRMIGGAASGIVSSVVRKIPIVGPELAGYAGNMANRVTTAIGRDTLRTAAQGVNNSIAKPDTPTVSGNDDTSFI